MIRTYSILTVSKGLRKWKVSFGKIHCTSSSGKFVLKGTGMSLSFHHTPNITGNLITGKNLTGTIVSETEINGKVTLKIIDENEIIMDLGSWDWSTLD